MSKAMILSLMAGALGVSGLVLPGCGSLGGCGGERPSSRPAESHEGHAHGQEGQVQGHDEAPGGAAEAARTVELRKIAPSPGYPLKTCVVSGETLGEMGDPVAYEYEGTEIQFCCPGCIKEFRKDPAPFLEKVRSARE